MIAIIIIAAAAAAVVLFIVFLKGYPPFGGRPSKLSREAISRSDHFSGKKFENLIPTSMNTGTGGMLGLLIEFIKGNPNGKPAEPIGFVPWEPLPAQQIQDIRATWLGHSAVILETGGLTLMLDPMLGRAPSPFPFIGSRRFSRDLPVKIEALPTIDAVIFSHDHYDHLDYSTIKRLGGKVKRFIVPLGVGAHLRRWGIPGERISEHDWWEELEYEGLKLACTPARHFSGRSVTDRDSTLWCSWVIRCGDQRIFFSGDSGYGPHFKQIGDKYGPFDLTMMECGQYDERWAAIHMMPEETVQAQLDVQGKLMIPIHWGAFTLALHDWNDPIERLMKASAERGVVAASPKIGEPVLAGGGSAAIPSDRWWK